jgi:hypothetical protein
MSHSDSNQNDSSASGQVTGRPCCPYNVYFTDSLALTYGRKGLHRDRPEGEQKIILAALEVINASELFGYVFDPERDFSLLEKWLPMYREMQHTKFNPNNWFKLVKYKLCAFVASQYRLTPPKKPFELEDRCDFLLGGRHGRWYARFSRTACEKCRHTYLSTISQGVKRGCPRADKGGLAEACRETFNLLTSIDYNVSALSQVTVPLYGFGRLKYKSSRPSFYSHYVGTRFCIRQQVDYAIKRIVAEVFTKPLKREDLRLYFPSTSATFTSSRRNGGAVSDVVHGLGNGDDFISNLPPLYLGTHGLWNEEYGVFEDRPCFLQDATPASEANIVAFFINRCMELHDDRVSIVALPEALKVRCITKGSGYTQWVLTFFQKFLWSSLKRHPAFELIGTPVTQDIILQRLKSLRPGEKFLNGDYKDATNGLHSWISNSIVDAICDQCLGSIDKEIFPPVSSSLRTLFKRLLTGHMIENPDDGTFSQQWNGQLMGSIMSFPVLCIANAALCLLAHEMAYNRFYSLRQLRLLINGDDCVFPCVEEVHTCWLALCRMFGMMPSVGKYYYTDDFVQINSVTFLYRNGRFQEIPFVNFGLLKMRKRSGLEIQIDSIFDKFSSYASNSKDLLRTLPERQKIVVYKQFIRQFGRFMSKNDVHLPWYVPCAFGGMGIQQLRGHFEMSPKDITLCNLMFADQHTFPSFGKDSTWKLFKRYNQFAERQGVPLVEGENECFRLYCLYMLRLSALHQDLGYIFSDSSRPDRERIRMINAVRRTHLLYLSKINRIESIKRFSDDVIHLTPFSLITDRE